KLIRESYKYADRLSNYLEDIEIISIANRSDICKKFSITVGSVIEDGVSLFTLKKNKRSLLQNLIKMKYSSDNLFILIGITWERALCDVFTKTNALEPEHILALAQ
ncbi:1583_t:CDS:2, partial [Racocetra persica]